MVTVLVAGIGGASLGTEIAKALRLAGGYRVIGCDVSPLAFGHYVGLFQRTELVPTDGYVERVLGICRREDVQVIVPGGEQPTVLLSDASEEIRSMGLLLAANAPEVVALLSDKARCFETLEKAGIEIPRTCSLETDAEIAEAPIPCVVKPSTGSGGSAFVFFARTREEIGLYASYLHNNGLVPIAQEYITHEHGEFTVGVLSNQLGKVEGVIALKRAFPAKLSIFAKGNDFLISSGYSQGHIGSYPDVCATAQLIAESVDSRGPLNVQGRVATDGRFLPFEINPRFSASTYLRALAGFNEIDYFIQRGLSMPASGLAIQTGWYLRGLDEVFVSEEELKV